ncbi:MAG: arginine--tRNA ligase [Planctomycetes bacterium]|nr:arginine--tRNA ligase [Planctomycetota bacterium]
MHHFRKEIAEAVARQAGLEPAQAEAALMTPPRREMGDYAFPCFVLAKAMKKSPAELAKTLARDIGSIPGVDRVEAVGPYVNFVLNDARLAEAVLREAVAQGARYGQSTDGAGKVVVIDYSSPNIAKPFHVGHLRSTIIGSALYRLFGMLGYTAVGINHLGDWGTQFGKQIVALKRWGRPEDVHDLMALNRLYVQYHQEEERQPALADEARAWFRRQEAGDAEALELWRAIRETSLQYFQRIYRRLGVQFDAYLGESFYNDKMGAIVEEAAAKGLATRSQGALVVDLSKQGIDPPAMLQKADGTTLYITRDLAAAKHRYETYAFHKMLYVVGAAQSFHFQQLFTVLKLLGYGWADACAHIPFGLVHGMSTRQGNVIYLEELLDEARQRALAYMRQNVEKRQELEDENAVAEAVGIGAIFFFDLSRQRVKDYTFDWDRAVSFDGDTGPYLMNAHARIAGIIRKCGIEPDSRADVSLLVEPEARVLVRLVGQYEEKLREAATSTEPSLLANYLLDLAHALHASYYKLRVKEEERTLAQARLLLYMVVKQVLASGLAVLGIPALERM